MNKYRLGLFLVGTVMALALGGCSTPATRIKANPEIYARLPIEQQIAVRTEAVHIALGEPTRIAQRTDEDGDSEVWHYLVYESESRALEGEGGPAGRGSSYLYRTDSSNRAVRDRFSVEFRNGIVSAITQERRNTP